MGIKACKLGHWDTTIGVELGVALEKEDKLENEANKLENKV